jgi:hypothetical protein
MSDNTVKPSREELLQKLRNKQKQGEMHRMTKKNRDTKLEKLEAKAKSEQEEMINQLKKCTPEQLKAFGLNQEMIDQLLKKDQPEETQQQQEETQQQQENELDENDLQKQLSSQTKLSIDNIFDIPDIHVPKMTVPINTQVVNNI